MSNLNNEINYKTDTISIRTATYGDLNDILKLNEESVHFLSPLSLEKLQHLHAQAEILKVVEINGIVKGFVLALREEKDYDSINYSWFASHYPSFLYVDRVVISTLQQGTGLGAMLYQEVFKHAKEVGVPYVTAEIDIDPPNPASLKFHEKYGFTEVGRQLVAGGKKAVSLQVSAITKP